MNGKINYRQSDLKAIRIRGRTFKAECLAKITLQGCCVTLETICGGVLAFNVSANDGEFIFR